MKGATLAIVVLSGVIDVSIHAPVKGATRAAAGHGLEPDLVSIHAPVKGATWMSSGMLMYVVPVSIHAPVKGATPP